jgi:glucosamine--fructose-6-phosphate aminotransferase (isomerizing)
MCQLAAYVGERPIAPLLLRALELQEPYYAGHATGLGVINGDSLEVVKDSGPVAKVKQSTEISSLEATAGIAHSRYNAKARDDARYNAREMAHPFLNDSRDLALMHNGTIYNYKEHWTRLKESHAFQSYVEEIDSITDSEVAVHMLSDALEEGISMGEALRSVTTRLIGGFLLAAITPEHPETVWIANWFQPCVVAVGDDETMFCSSRIGFHDVHDELDRVFEPPRNSILKLTPGKVEVTTMDPDRRVLDWEMDEGKAAELIIKALKEEKELGINKLNNTLYPAGWAEIFSVSPETFDKEYKRGFRYVNEYFAFMDKLVKDGFIRERIAMKDEGGFPYTPRFTYSIA